MTDWLLAAVPHYGLWILSATTFVTSLTLARLCTGAEFGLYTVVFSVMLRFWASPSSFRFSLR